MPECHRCEHDGRCHDACLTCKGPSEPSHHGRTHISIDSGVDESGQTLGEVSAALAAPVQADPPDDAHVDLARRVLACIMSLSVADYLLVQHVSRGRNMPEYAREHGMSVSGVKGRWASLVRKHPEMGAMLANCRSTMPTKPDTHRIERADIPSHVSPRPPESRPSAARRGYDGTWQRLRKLALHSSPVCAECGRLATEVHHVKPISEGGERLEQANLLPICKACHSRITGQARGAGRTQGVDGSDAISAKSAENR